MAIRCGFFNSDNERQRKYYAEDMNQPYIGLVSNGVIPNRPGESEEDQSALGVLQLNGMNVKVVSGRGIFSNKWFWLDADYELTVPSNDSMNTQWASVIVRIDNRETVKEAFILMIQNESDKTQIPEINTIPNVDDYRLANIEIVRGATSISQANIHDTRPLEECGFCVGLIEQVDTDELYRQWEAMFNNWFDSVQIGLKTQATLTTSLTSSHRTQETESIIPINISQYNKDLDILQVAINGLDLYEGLDYTILNNTQIRLTKSIYAGNVVSFNVLKSIEGSQASTIVEQFQDLQQIVNEVVPQVDDLTYDSGWINLTLASGTAVAGLTPAVRKVGKVVYLRGALDGITTSATTTQVTLCTLPEAFAPTMEQYFTHLVGGTGSGVGYTTVRFKVNRNQASGGNATIVINGSSGTIKATQTIPIGASFIID